MSQVFSVFGETNATALTGTFPMVSELFRGSRNEIRPPKGCKTFILDEKISGRVVDVFLQRTRDVTVTTPTWTTISAYSLSATGELNITPEKKVIITSPTGKEAFRFTWSQATAARSNIGFVIELSS